MSGLGADVLVAVGGSYGTLSELGFALKSGKRVVGLKMWDIKGMVPAATAEEAVRLAAE
jgi:predicted Rossmann-fold nucleotide-binding protein